MTMMLLEKEIKKTQGFIRQEKAEKKKIILGGLK